MTTVYATKVTQAYLNRRAAHEAGGSAINFVAGTVIVGDGNGSVPTISSLIAANGGAGGVLHEVWRGTIVNAVTVDPQTASQIDILCVIPTTDGNGAEIGPFWVREFVITDENGVPMIVGTTQLEKSTGAAQGQTSDLAFIAAIGESNSSTVILTPPAAGFATSIDVYNIVADRTPLAAQPLYRTDNPNDSGHLKSTFHIQTATQPTDVTDASKLGAGRPATNAEWSAGAPAPGSLTAWPWPTLQQIKTLITSIEPGLLHYGIDTGQTGSAFAVNVSPDITTYVAGDTVMFVPAHDNLAGGCTLAADLGAVPIKLSDGVTPVPKGAIAANKLAIVTHDGSVWRLVYSAALYPETSLWHAATAGGTANALTLNLNPAVSARGNVCIRAKITATNGGAATGNYGFGGDIPIVLNSDGSALIGGEMPAGAEAILFDDGTYLRLVNPAPLGRDATPGARSGLIVRNSVSAPDTQILVIADSLVVGNASVATKRLRNVNVTLNSATSGIGGMDVGGIAPSTAYDIYIGVNPAADTVSGWFTAEGNAPNAPVGYTLFRRVSWTRTDSSGRFLRITQVDDEWRYIAQGSAGTNTKTPPVFASGEQGISGNTPTGWVSVSLAGLIPLKSLRVELIGNPTGTIYTTLAYAPNPNYARPGDTIGLTSLKYFEGVNQSGTIWPMAQHVSLWLEVGVTVYVMQQANVLSAVLGGKIII